MVVACYTMLYPYNSIKVTVWCCKITDRPHGCNGCRMRYLNWCDLITGGTTHGGLLSGYSLDGEWCLCIHMKDYGIYTIYCMYIYTNVYIQPESYSGYPRIDIFFGFSLFQPGISTKKSTIWTTFGVLRVSLAKVWCSTSGLVCCAGSTP